MVKSIKDYSGGQFSQNGEAGIIDECIRRMKLKPGVAVEFGAPTKQFCSNIYHLIEKGWDCQYFDSDPQEPGITKVFLGPANINKVLPKCQIASFDTDGWDYVLWQAYKDEPDIVIIEINSSLPPLVEYVSTDKGSSFGSMNLLAEEKGYFLLAHTGNCVYIKNKWLKLFSDRSTEFNPSWL